MDAKQELTWFIIIVAAIGVLWFVSGGLKSPTKNSPVVQAAPGSNTATTSKSGSWFSFLFPWSSGRNNQKFSLFNFTPPTYSTGSQNNAYDSNGNISNGNQNNNPSYGNTLYGADNPPGPAAQQKDALSIDFVSPSYDQQGNSGQEYMQISAPDTNKNPILLTGMLLKSRMTGNQANIGEGVNLYYSNTINQTAPIFIYPGQTADIITGRSPIGYSFRTNKCIGYLNNYYQNFVIAPYSNCPAIINYPLPSRPNAFNDDCLNFLKSIGSCQTSFSFPSNLTYDCKNFITDRANYTRCVADFSNDGDFLGNNWNIYLGRDGSLWKTQREIIDLVDSRGNVISTYTY